METSAEGKLRFSCEWWWPLTIITLLVPIAVLVSAFARIIVWTVIIVVKYNTSSILSVPPLFTFGPKVKTVKK